MTSPEETYETWKDVDSPKYEQDSFAFDVDIFPAKIIKGDYAETVWIPLTKNPSDPVNGRSMVPARVPDNVSADVFKQILSGAFQTYLDSGRIRYEDVAQLSGHHVPTVRSIMETEEFGYALSIRGVDTQGVGTLSPQQDAALMILTDIGSNRTWGQRLKEAGISQAIFTTWMKNPTFARRFGNMAQDITDNHGLALVQLGQKVAQGDLPAIKFQLEVSGRYNPAQQQQLDVLVMVNKVMESLAKHLGGHPEILLAVAGDMRQLAESVSQQRVIQIEPE